LRVLELQDNQLKRLPEWFSSHTLPILTYLHLAENQLTDLPLALGSFPHLVFLNAEFNDQLTVHQKVHVDAGLHDPGALLRYLKECVAGGTQPLRNFRLILLGEPNVGKSALVECLMQVPGWWYWSATRLKHTRARTPFPIIFPYTLEGVDRAAADSLHALITDPPGRRSS